MKPIIVKPGDGKSITAFGDTIVFPLVGSQTGDEITIGIVSTPPGGGPPLHVHRRENEIFLMESGDIEVLAEGEWIKAPPGSVVFLPKDVPHQFRNAGDTTSRHWVICTPSGFENFYSKCSDLFAAGGPPDMEKIMGTCAEFGMEILGPPPGVH